MLEPTNIVNSLLLSTCRQRYAESYRAFLVNNPKELLIFVGAKQPGKLLFLKVG